MIDQTDYNKIKQLFNRFQRWEQFVLECFELEDYQDANYALVTMSGIFDEIRRLMDMQEK